MKRIPKVVLVSATILSAVFLTNPAVAGRKEPPDPLTQALQDGALKQLDDEVVRQIGQADEVGAPLRLDQRTAFPPAFPIDDFQPKALEISSENMTKPLEPGDYSIPVIGFCTAFPVP